METRVTDHQIVVLSTKEILDTYKLSSVGNLPPLKFEGVPQSREDQETCRGLGNQIDQ